MTRHGGSRFPDPRGAPSDAPLAVGGDLEPPTLLAAYALGIFPWPSRDRRLYWWSPDPRAVFVPPSSVHVSRSLSRTLRSGRLRTTTDRAFTEVMAACAQRPGEGTWITSAMRAAYERLHHLGAAHSLEVWAPEGRLVGGIYGVALGAAFMAESMFHRETDASKVALVGLAAHLDERGYALLDVQLPTDHLLAMGAQVIPREEYLGRLGAAVARPVSFGRRTVS